MDQNFDVEERMSEARRKFLTSCGRFAVATPPALALLLAADERNYATAASGGGFSTGAGRRGPQGNNGFGNGGNDGVPGHSDFGDNRR